MRGLSLAAICAAWLAGDALGCASNNCLRALSNTKGGRNASADCREYLERTVTPGTSTFTRTVSVTSTVPTLTVHTTAHATTLHDLQGRQVSATSKSIPTYASACGSAAAFSSACSCIGVSAVTVTADADSTTITETVVRTVALTTVRPSLGNHTVSLNSTSGLWQNKTGTSTALSSTSAHKITSASTQTSSARTSNPSTLAPTSPQTFTSASLKQTTSFRSAFSNGTSVTRLSSSAPSNGTSWSSGSTGSSGATLTSPWNFSRISTTLATSSIKPSNSSIRASISSSLGRSSIFPQSTSPWNSATTTKVQLNSTSSAPFLNVTSAVSTTLSSVTAIHWVNATTIVTSLRYNLTTASATGTRLQNSTGRWRSSSFPAVTAKLNTTTTRWLNTSIPTASPNVTTARWHNTTRLPFNTTRLPFNTTRLPFNTTTVRWGNSTLRPNATTTRWRNSSATATPTPSPVVDLTCGETTVPFALQASQPGSVFDKWYVHLVGDSLLFTSLASSASAFSVEHTGHLCAVGHLTADGKPYLASVGTLDNSSAVWMMDQNMLQHMNSSYGAVNCTAGGTLNCAANATSHWISCGLQLDLSSSGGANVPYDGVNCTSLDLIVVPQGGGGTGSGNGTARGLYANGTSMGALQNVRRQRRFPGGVTYLETPY